MRWIKRNHPKKTEQTGIVGSPRYLVRYYNNQYNLDRWLGDRWLKGNSGGNIITHYMLIREVENV